MWYSYFGGYDDSVDNFNAGRWSDDKLYLPNGVNVARYWNTLYIYGNNGGTLTVNANFDYTDTIKYSTNGSDIFNCSIANFSHPYGDELTYYDDVPVYVGNGSTSLYVYGENRDIRLDENGTVTGKYYIGMKDIVSYAGGTNNLWGDNADNVIKDNGSYANSGLWGGWEGNDTLTGGNGADTFFFNRDGGHDIITDANSNDSVFVFNANPGECNYYYDDANNVMHLYVGSGELEVNCSTGDEYYSMTYPVYQFADGTRLTYVGGNWQGVSWDSAENINYDSPLSLFDDSSEFVYSYGDGRKDILSTDAENTVILNGVTLDQISSAEITNNGVNLKFNDEGSFNVYGQVGKFIVNGESYSADYQNKTWNSEN